MKTISCVVSFLMFSIFGAGVLAEYFIDEFEGPLSDEWVQVNTGTLKFQTKENQLQVRGEQAADWLENSITRDITEVGEFKSAYVLTKSNALHPELSLRNLETGAYFATGSSHGWHFVYTVSPDGGWTGWLDPPNLVVLGEDWTEFSIIKTAEGVYEITVGDQVIVENVAALDTVTHIRFNTYAVAGTQDIMYVEYIEVNREDATAVTSTGKLATTWASVKAQN